MDFGSAFSTIVPANLAVKLWTDLCATGWILDFLSGRRQNGQQYHPTDPQHWCSSGLCSYPTPVLSVRMTAASHGSGVIVQVSDDTAVVELITDSDETAYREEVRSLAQCLSLYHQVPEWAPASSDHSTPAQWRTSWPSASLPVQKHHRWQTQISAEVSVNCPSRGLLSLQDICTRWWV